MAGEPQKTPQKAPDRLEVLKKRAQYELEGKFDIDLEEDPPTLTLMPNKVDYLQKKLSSKIMRKVAYFGAKKFMQSMIKNGALRIKRIEGIENWKSIQTGAVITCNHFNILDSLAMYQAYDMLNNKKRRMYRVIREGNYTNPPPKSGLLMRHCDTLPLSSNRETMVKFMRSVDILLSKNNYVLIYPEQAMWWNYRKPRPLKDGGFKIAVRNNVPVLPVFITMNDSGNFGPDGFEIQEYSIHIFKPIYPDKTKSKQENIKSMMEQNFELWKNCYEKTYGVPLSYTTKAE